MHLSDYLSLAFKDDDRLQFMPDDWLGRWITGLANRHARITTVSPATGGNVPELSLDPGWRWLAPLLKLRRPTMSVQQIPALPPELAAGPTAAVELGRGWEGIHYLLTGIPVDAPNSQDASTPAFWFLRGGLTVGTHKFGRLPCRAFKSGEVSRWCDYLETWNEPRFRARYDLADMKQKAVYPAMFDNGVEKDYSLHYLLGDFGILTAFLGERVTAGDGVILEFQ